MSLQELFSLVRHSKVSLIKEALDYLPSKKFDKSLIKSQYIQDHGTVYVHGYESLSFHVNKVDEGFGNTMLMLACQNGNSKLVKYLVAKGVRVMTRELARQPRPRPLAAAARPRRCPRAPCGRCCGC